MTAPRTVLITRPEPDAAALAARIGALGHRAVVEPLLGIRFLDDAVVDLSDARALAFTSANGVRALVHAAGRALPTQLDVFAVGDATAQAARAAGFAHVTAAGGDVGSLAAAIVEAGVSRDGVVLHVAGRDRAGDLVALLEAEGIAARRLVLYAAEWTGALSPAVRAALAAGRVDDVMIFSPRTARRFVTLIEAAGLAEAMRTLRLLALSRNVAEAAGTLSFGEVAVAAHPDQDALLALLAPGSGYRQA